MQLWGPLASGNGSISISVLKYTTMGFFNFDLGFFFYHLDDLVLQVDIGNGVLVDQASLLLAQGKRDALFVKDLAVAVFGSRLLMDSSVLGKQNRIFIGSMLYVAAWKFILFLRNIVPYFPVYSLHSVYRRLAPALN